jgi:choline dehydrogenase-like flavoprotein
MFDVVIVGSGASGVAAALSLSKKGIFPVLIDAGLKPPSDPPIEENFYDYCERNDCFSQVIGRNYEGLSNLERNRIPVPAKLTSPKIRFVTERAAELSPVIENNYNLIQSFARGGLGNAWGAGLYKYTDRDLEDFPVKEKDLEPWYKRLSGEIGISGENDDLTPYFGRDDHLQPPLRLSINAAHLLKRFRRKKSRLQKKGVFIGRPRLGVLSEEKDGRKPCDYRNLEFWEPVLSYIYSPAMTLEKLIRSNKIRYLSGLLVQRWDRRKENIIVQARSIDNGQSSTFSCKRLILAAGAVNSARLALSSRNDYRTRLTLLDNPALQFPLVLPGRIGRRLEREAFGLTQLNMIYEREADKKLYQGSILEVTSPSRAEFFGSFPLSARDNLKMIRMMLPALMVMQMFFPIGRKEGALLSLEESGKLKIQGSGRRVEDKIIGEILKIMRAIGAFSHPFLVIHVPEGHGIHYAGTLPMGKDPDGPYMCETNGELWGEPGVFVVDGSVFPVLPAKNFSFAVMANAMRIACNVACSLKE